MFNRFSFIALTGGVLALISASTASAEVFTGCVKSSNGQLYHLASGTTPSDNCNPDDTTASFAAGDTAQPHFVLRDSSGNQVGTVISITNTFLGPGSVSQPAFFGPIVTTSIAVSELNGVATDDRKIAITARGGRFPVMSVVFYTGTACDMTPLLPAAQGFPPAFYATAVIPNGAKLDVYVATSDEPSDETIVSRRNRFTGNCEPFSDTRSVFSAEKLNSHLDDVFPPILTLHQE